MIIISIIIISIISISIIIIIIIIIISSSHSLHCVFPCFLSFSCFLLSHTVAGWTHRYVDFQFHSHPSLAQYSTFIPPGLHTCSAVSSNVIDFARIFGLNTRIPV